jgi:hypothetical protein
MMIALEEEGFCAFSRRGNAFTFAYGLTVMVSASKFEVRVESEGGLSIKRLHFR